MSLTYEVNILCDGDPTRMDCEFCITTTPNPIETCPEAIKQQMLYEQWIERDGKHYCPNCAKRLGLLTT